MTREQCRAILANLDLIKHFAANGDVGHRAPNCHGEMMPISICRGIGLNGLKEEGSTWYLRLKPRYRFNNHTQKMERVMRHWPEVPTEHDVIYCEATA